MFHVETFVKEKITFEIRDLSLVMMIEQFIPLTYQLYNGRQAQVADSD